MIDIIDLFIVKYNDYAQNFLDFHLDRSFMSFNILLSDPNTFKGGGTCFNDGLVYNISQGDVLIHSGKIKHAGLPVIEGKRYLIVGFLNITKT
jgi:predicted 2-oxoglutarate/Fe(II)-dependent dioxygenase YbiX